MQCLQRSTHAARIQAAASSSGAHCHHSIRRWPLQHGGRLPQVDGAQRNFACRAYKPNKPDLGDSVIAALPYLLPMMDVLPYGRYLFMQYPYIARAMAPLGPVYSLYNSFPLAPFLIFIGVYSGIVGNQNFSRFIRYNAMQAVLLDILIVIPQLLLDNVFKAPQDGLALQAYISACNTLFLFVAVCVAYGAGSSLVGQTARLPLVAEAADSQVKDGPGGW